MKSRSSSSSRQKRNDLKRNGLKRNGLKHTGLKRNGLRCSEEQQRQPKEDAPAVPKEGGEERDVYIDRVRDRQTKRDKERGREREKEA